MSTQPDTPNVNTQFSLYETIASFDSLWAGWNKVSDNDGAPGADGISIIEFSEEVHGKILHLRGVLLARSYTPQPLLSFSRKKQSGGIRVLSIPTVADRIVQASAHRVLSPVLDNFFSDVSYGFRKGISRLNAVDQIESLRNEGYQYVVDADIEQFFDNVDHELLLQRCAEYIPDEDVVHLFRLWISSDAIVNGVRTKRERGLPQGAPISPLLANLFLDKFDDTLQEQGLKLVRFADDFLILCKTKPEAENALELSGNLLADLHLKLQKEKTRVATFDDGFRYLGYLFVRSVALPSKRPASPEQDTLLQAVKAAEHITGDQPAVKPEIEKEPTAERSEEREYAYSPFLRTLYIQEQGATLRKESERLIIQKDEQELLDVQAIKVEQIFIFGACMITPAAMRFCLMHTIPITLLSNSGDYYGRVESTTNDFTVLQRMQVLRSLDDEFTLTMAQQFVKGKIENSIDLLQRYHRKKQLAIYTETINDLKTILNKIDGAHSLNQLLGFEGNASARYFSTFGSSIENPDFHFLTRTRQPPLDRMNSLLSFTYTLLFYNIYSLVQSRGLNPHLGFLHRERRNHPALVSDLIEEFRCVAESLAMYLVNNKIIRAKDFYNDAHSGIPFLLTDAARKKVIQQFEETMQQTTFYADAQRSLNYRRCIEAQVQMLTHVLINERPEYKPFKRGG